MLFYTGANLCKKQSSAQIEHKNSFNLNLCYIQLALLTTCPKRSAILLFPQVLLYCFPDWKGKVDIRDIDQTSLRYKLTV